MAYSEAFNYLLNGSIFTAVHIMYVGVMGYWHVLILYMFTLLMTYMASRHELAVFAVSLVASGVIVLYELLPSYMHAVPYAVTAITLAVGLWRVYSGKT